MVDVFDRALRTLMRDPNLSIAAEWQPAAGGEWTELRLIRTIPQETIQLDMRTARAGAIEADIRMADLPQALKRGDLLRWGDPVVTFRVESAEPDALGLSWRATIARQTPRTNDGWGNNFDEYWGA